MKIALFILPLLTLALQAAPNFIGPETDFTRTLKMKNNAAEWRAALGVATSKDVTAFGAKGDGVTDDSDAFQAAADLGNTLILIPSGTFKLTRPILMSKDNTAFRGEGPYSTTILFAPSTNGASAFKWQKPTNVRMWGGGVKDLAFSDGHNPTYDKTAIEFIDASGFHIENVHTYPWGSTTTNSIGILGRGRELITIDRCQIEADRPVVFWENPYFPGIDLDQSSIIRSQIYCNPGGQNACIEFRGAMDVTDVTIRDSGLALGRYGIAFFGEGMPGVVSQNIVIDRVKHEQMQGEGGYSYYFSPVGRNLFWLKFNNVQSAYQQNGWYLRNCQWVALDNCMYAGSKVGFNVDTSNHGISIRDSFFQVDGTAELGGMQKQFQLSSVNTASPVPNNAYYASTIHTPFQIFAELVTNSVLVGNVRFPLELVSKIGPSNTPALGFGTGLSFSADVANNTNDVAREIGQINFFLTNPDFTNRTSVLQLKTYQNGEAALVAQATANSFDFFTQSIFATNVLAQLIMEARDFVVRPGGHYQVYNSEGDFSGQLFGSGDNTYYYFGRTNAALIFQNKDGFNTLGLFSSGGLRLGLGPMVDPGPGNLAVAGTGIFGSYVRLPNNTAIYGRNFGNNADVTIAMIDSANKVALAPDGSTTDVKGPLEVGGIPGITTTWTNLISGVVTQRLSAVNGIVVTNEVIAW
jgi:hypothetical protein